MVWGVEKTIPLPSGEAEGRPARPRTETRALSSSRIWSAVSARRPARHRPRKARRSATRSCRACQRTGSRCSRSTCRTTTAKSNCSAARCCACSKATPNVVRRPSARAPHCCAPVWMRRHRVPYFLHEEEVSRAGVRVTQSFQRTRWRDGRAWVWLGVRKQTGRGEGSSGLAFDRIARRREPDLVRRDFPCLGQFTPESPCKVEARGVEPLSSKPSAQASTCLAGDLFLRSRRLRRHTPSPEPPRNSFTVRRGHSAVRLACCPCPEP